MKKVDDVLAEFDENQLERYIERVATGRNHAPHYRNPRVSSSSSPSTSSSSSSGQLTTSLGSGWWEQMGCTLVYELQPQHLPAAMAHFRRRVDEALGKGCYEWFHSTALHVTVRGL
jgi:hypothetical protein